MKAAPRGKTHHQPLTWKKKCNQLLAGEICNEPQARGTHAKSPSHRKTCNQPLTPKTSQSVLRVGKSRNGRVITKALS